MRLSWWFVLKVTRITPNLGKSQITSTRLSMKTICSKADSWTRITPNLGKSQITSTRLSLKTICSKADSRISLQVWSKNVWLKVMGHGYGPKTMDDYRMLAISGLHSSLYFKRSLLILKIEEGKSQTVRNLITRKNVWRNNIWWEG